MPTKFRSMKTLKIIGVMVLISLILFLSYISEFWSSTYFHNHHTSWLIIITQITALFLAIREYKKWKTQTYSKSEHNNLIELYELTTRLKSGIIEYDKTSRNKKLISKIIQNQKPNQSALNLDYELYSELHDLYHNLIGDVLVATESKSNLISNLYNLEDLHDSVNGLLKEAKSRRNTIMDLVEGENGEESDTNVNKIFKNIEDQIRKDSDILD